MAGALQGLRVVDFGQYLAGPLVAMILADNGAEVVRVDPPGGPRWQHQANAILQRGKRSIMLDLKAETDADVARAMVARADIVVENFRPGVMARLGLGPQAATAENRRLIYCSLPGFGSTDPRAAVAGWEDVVEAAASVYTAAGYQSVSMQTRGPGPSFNPLPIASTFAAFIATNSILAALLARRRSGLGQTIEVPLFDATFEALGYKIQKLPPGTPTSPFNLAQDNVYQCADGRWVYLVLATPTLWARFSHAFMDKAWFDTGLADNAALAADPALAHEAVRRLTVFFRTRKAEEWDHDVNAAGVPLTVCRTSQDWLHSQQARESECVIALDDPELGKTVQAGYCVQLSATPPHVRHARRALDRDRSSVLRELSELPLRQSQFGDESLSVALDGVRVIDVSQILAAPTSARILAEFGADVIKVNHPALPHFGVLHTNSGKRTALVDLARKEGQEIVLSLAQDADVFLQNFSRGTAERLGIGEADIRARRPDVVYASISAYGYKGPRGGFRGFEAIGQTITGMALRTADSTPRLQRLVLNDYATGQLGAMAILLGLYHRAVTGEGQHVSSALTAAGTYHQLPFMIDYAGRVWNEPTESNPKGWGPLDRLYETSDGWLYLAAPGKDGRSNVIACEGLEDLASPSQPIEEALTQRLRTLPADVWIDRLRRARVAAHRVMDLDSVVEDANARARGLVVVRDHPGIGPVRSAGPVPICSRTPARLSRPAPLPGADTEAVLREAGYGDRYMQLLRDGIVAERLRPGTHLWL